MINDISGLRHITVLARDAGAVDTFYTRALGQRRVKRTVNPDAPGMVQLCYGDETGMPGSVTTCLPFPDIARARRGVGEVGHVAYAVPVDALDDWARRYRGARRDTLFGEDRLHLTGPDGEAILLVASDEGVAQPWEGILDPTIAPRGLHSVSLRVASGEAMEELLRLLGAAALDTEGRVTRYRLGEGGATILDLDRRPDMPRAMPGGGSIHRVAFAVPDEAALNAARGVLLTAEYEVTPVIDRHYYQAFYLHAPGGMVFEIATRGPGYTLDEPVETLGEAVCLPPDQETSRGILERELAFL